MTDNEREEQLKTVPAESADAVAVVAAEEEEKPLDKNVKLMSPMRMVLRRFFRSKLSIAGIIMLAALFLFCWRSRSSCSMIEQCCPYATDACRGRNMPVCPYDGPDYDRAACAQKSGGRTHSHAQ